MTAFDYSTGPRITDVLGHTVYTKATWAADWVEAPNLTCVECQWTAAPNFNTALLQWETGLVILPGDTLPTTFGTWVGRGQFVKIVWQCDDGGTLVWVGFVDSSSWPTEAFGRQQLVCYGLERALSLTPIATSAWVDTSGASPTVRRSNMPFAFNIGPDGYRSENPATGSVYAFASLHDPDAPIYRWSTRQIVQYLLTYSLPTNAYGVAAIPWALDQAAQLPDWDAPQVHVRNRTVWDVLNELISPNNQLGFTAGSDGTTCYLRTFTHLPSIVTYGSQTIPANPNLHTVVFAPDALTAADLSDVGATYDQVIVRGGRRKTICTLQYGTHLEPNWTTAEQDEYDAADQANPSYSGWTTAERRLRNQAARSKIERVYRDFRIKSNWNFQIGGNSIFPGSTAPPRSVVLMDTIPIHNKIADWSGPVDQNVYVVGDELLQPHESFITVVDPTGDQTRLNLSTQLSLLSFKQVSQLSNQHAYTIDLYFNERMFEIQVEGAPQHVIASNTFTALSDDYSVDGGIDYETMQLTACLMEDRFVQGVFPASVSADVVRRLVVDVGDRYQQVYIVPGTVAALNSEGDPQTSDGGYLHDDSGELAALAQLIATGLVPTRKRATWRSQRRISGIAVGDLITTAAGTAVNAPITEIRINAPTAIGRPASAPTQSFATFGGVFDPLQILRRVGVLTT